jgi:hypothetical protein
MKSSHNKFRLLIDYVTKVYTWHKNKCIVLKVMTENVYRYAPDNTI